MAVVDYNVAHTTCFIVFQLNSALPYKKELYIFMHIYFFLEKNKAANGNMVFIEKLRQREKDNMKIVQVAEIL